jgi:hypothetical protein
MTRTPEWIICVALITLAAGPVPSAAQPKDEPVSIRKVIVSDGLELHYVERGTGVPVVFVHGSLSDGGYWNDQVGAFAESGYRAIAYSRRYNLPNTNKARQGYSAAVDADDLAALIGKLQLGKIHVVGPHTALLRPCSWRSSTPNLSGRWCWPRRRQSPCWPIFPVTGLRSGGGRSPTSRHGW